MFIPSISFAATLTQIQANAIIALLEAFNVNQQTITIVQAELETSAASNTTTQATTTRSLGSTGTTTPSGNTKIIIVALMSARQILLCQVWTDIVYFSSAKVAFLFHIEI